MGSSNRELGEGSLQGEWGWERSQGQRWYWGVKQGKELGASKGTGVIGVGTGSGEEEESGGGDLGVFGWDGGCSRGFMGIKSYRNVSVEDWEVMDN